MEVLGVGEVVGLYWEAAAGTIMGGWRQIFSVHCLENPKASKNIPKESCSSCM